MRGCRFISICTLLLAIGWSVPARAQRVQIPNGTLVPQNPPTTGATLGAPSFDPYAVAPPSNTPTMPSLFGQPPTAAPPTNSYGVNPFGTSTPYTGSPYGSAPTSAPPFNGPSGNPFVMQPGQSAQSPMPYGNPYAQPTYPGTQQQGGMHAPNGTWSQDIGRTNPHQSGEPLKLFQNIRLRQTWLSRMNELEGLGINDSEIATTVAFPTFLGTTQPLYISPGFILSLWDGPGGVSADLPPTAYSGYLDFDYTTNPQHQLGGDLHVRLGVYSDFATINTHSFRVSGAGLGTFRMSPTVQLKFGVEYINRNDIKLLPAGGILWTPSPQVRFDIYFPRPKLAMYVTTLGMTEIWGYVGGEYGGGAWTIERADDRGADRIDINDIRVFLGADFVRGPGFRAFFEGGYVFNREIVYVVSPQDDFSPDPTFMLRGGIAY